MKGAPSRWLVVGLALSLPVCGGGGSSAPTPTQPPPEPITQPQCEPTETSSRMAIETDYPDHCRITIDFLIENGGCEAIHVNSIEFTAKEVDSNITYCPDLKTTFEVDADVEPKSEWTFRLHKAKYCVWIGYFSEHCTRKYDAWADTSSGRMDVTTKTFKHHASSCRQSAGCSSREK